MADPVEHLGYAETHPEEWRLGVTCEDCRSHVAARREAHGGGKQVAFAIHRLKNDNQGGYTQHELHRDIVESAKADGRDIQPAGKAWS